MVIPTPGAVGVAVIAAGLAVVAITVGALALQDADAHLAVDEVARHGAEGHGGDQIRHSHPHNRTIWYQQESANYTGDAVDRYEAGLGTQVIYRDRIVQVPVEAPPEIVYQTPVAADLTFVAFDIEGGLATCPDDATRKLYTSVKSDSGQPKGLLQEVYWTDAHDVEHRSGFTTTASGEIYDRLLIVHGESYPELDTYHLVGIVHQGRGICTGPMPEGNHGPLFTVDITGDCQGQRIDVVSRSSEGYNITAVGHQASAACLH